MIFCRSSVGYPRTPTFLKKFHYFSYWAQFRNKNYLTLLLRGGIKNFPKNFRRRLVIVSEHKKQKTKARSKTQRTKGGKNKNCNKNSCRRSRGPKFINKTNKYLKNKRNQLVSQKATLEKMPFSLEKIKKHLSTFLRRGK